MIKDVHSANCFPLYRCHSTWRVQNAAGEITVRSRPLCPSCPSLSVPVRPAPCRGRAHPWKMVHSLLFSVQNKSIVISFSIAYIVCSVCRIPAKSLNLLIRSSWESALAFHTGRQHQISRGTFRYTNTFSSLFPSRYKIRNSHQNPLLRIKLKVLFLKKKQKSIYIEQAANAYLHKLKTAENVRVWHRF